MLYCIYKIKKDEYENPKLSTLTGSSAPNDSKKKQKKVK